MDMYLCGKTALDFWNVPYIRDNIEPANAEFEEEFIVFTEKSVHHPQRMILHTCKIKNAIKYTEKGVCTLPLIFLQLANHYTIHQLIYLGLQICSKKPNGDYVCRHKELEKCARELVGHRGRRKALRALKYIQEGSRSPMESLLYMFLRLPNALGGCGFTRLKLDCKIDLRPNINKVYYADLYDPSKKLLIEFDGFKHHNNPNSFSKDVIRSSNLESEGYSVLSVRSAQLYSLKDYRILVKNISRRVAKPVRIRARKFISGFIGIRNILFKKYNSFRTRLKRISRNDLPNFIGVDSSFADYNKHEEIFKKKVLFLNHQKIPNSY